MDTKQKRESGYYWVDEIREIEGIKTVPNKQPSIVYFDDFGRFWYGSLGVIIGNVISEKLTPPENKYKFRDLVDIMRSPGDNRLIQLHGNCGNDYIVNTITFTIYHGVSELKSTVTAPTEHEAVEKVLQILELYK